MRFSSRQVGLLSKHGFDCAVRPAVYEIDRAITVEISRHNTGCNDRTYRSFCDPLKFPTLEGHGLQEPTFLIGQYHIDYTIVVNVKGNGQIENG